MNRTLLAAAGVAAFALGVAAAHAAPTRSHPSNAAKASAAGKPADLSAVRKKRRAVRSRARRDAKGTGGGRGGESGSR
jgi:hypothetical protein